MISITGTRQCTKYLDFIPANLRRDLCGCVLLLGRGVLSNSVTVIDVI